MLQEIQVDRGQRAELLRDLGDRWGIASTLNNLGILNRAENRTEETRKAFEEALKIYEAFAKQDPDQFSPLVERLTTLLKHLPK